MTKAVAALFGRQGAAFNPVVVLVVLLAVSVAIEPALIGERAIRNVLISASPLLLVAAAQALVLLTGGVDLSVGSVISLAGVIAAALLKPYPDLIAPIVLLSLAAGVAVGLLNGWFVAYARLNPFIITLAVAIAIQGLTLEIMYQPEGFASPAFRQLARAVIGPVPVVSIAILAVFIALGVFLRRTSAGIAITAIGGSETSARMSGVPTRRLKLAVYAASGFLSACAGLLLAARVNSGDPLIGEPYSLDSITAAVLGGTSIVGGTINLAGTFLAGILLALLNSLLNLQGISTFFQWIIKGGILIAALSLDLLRRRGAAT